MARISDKQLLFDPGQLSVKAPKSDVTIVRLAEGVRIVDEADAIVKIGEEPIDVLSDAIKVNVADLPIVLRQRKYAQRQEALDRIYSKFDKVRISAEPR